MQKIVASSKKPLISMEGICKSYSMGRHGLSVLDEAALSIHSGERCAIVGPSGSGKSTLLNLLGLLDTPDEGRFLFNERDISCTTSDERSELRNRHIGFVFQHFNLLPRLNALDNVALPLLYGGYSQAQARRKAYHLLQRVGLSDRAAHRPTELSGGQRQRIAIARALVCRPSLILADEPTGNLDAKTAGEIMQMLLRLNQEQGVTLVVVTHDAELARQLDRRFHVSDGRIEEIV